MRNIFFNYVMMNKWQLERERERYEKNGWNWYNSPYWEKLDDIEHGYRDNDGFPLVAFI